MPPNRQEVASLARRLSAENLASFVQSSKFPPLTQEATATHAGQAEEKKEKEGETCHRRPAGDDDAKKPSPPTANDAVTKQPHESSVHEEDMAPPPEENASYWDWPQLSPRVDAEVEEAEAEDLAAAETEAWTREVARRQAVLANILAEEEARKVLSIDGIEANLKKDAERRSREGVVAKILADEEARNAVSVESIEANLQHDAERRRRQSEEDKKLLLVQNEEKAAEEASYWEWKDEHDLPPKQCADLVSAAHIEEMLKKESRRIDVHARVGLASSSGGEHTKGGDNYWQWRTLTKDQEKIRIVESILEDERARLLLQSTHIASNLKTDAARASTTGVDGVCHSKEETKEDYWSWNESASPPSKDLDSATSSPPAPDSGSYWEWSLVQLTEQARKAAVDSILRDEEARRILSADRLVENLKADTWRRAREEVDGWYYRQEVETQRTEGADQEEGYWDM